MFIPQLLNENNGFCVWHTRLHYWKYLLYKYLFCLRTKKWNFFFYKSLVIINLNTSWMEQFTHDWLEILSVSEPLVQPSWFLGMKSYKTDLFFDILEGWRGDDRETHEEHVCLWITERTQPVIILLTWEQQEQDEKTQKTGTLFFSSQSEIKKKKQFQTHSRYLLCQKVLECRALRRSSLLLRNCQKPLSEDRKTRVRYKVWFTNIRENWFTYSIMNTKCNCRFVFPGWYTSFQWAN